MSFSRPHCAKCPDSLLASRPRVPGTPFRASLTWLLHSGRPAGTAAFTLIELLVVITIIAVLAALLFPAFSVARWKSYNATCVSNLRQLGMQMQMYADENDDHLPVGTDWFWGDVYHIPSPGTPKLNRVMAGRIPAQLWHCPADLGFKRWTTDFSKVLLDYTPSAFKRTGQSYDYNALMFWNPSTGHLSLVRVSDVKRPDQIALMKDSHHMWHPNNNPLRPLNRNKNDEGSWNILYLDGHAVRTPNSTGLYGTDIYDFWTQKNNPRQP